MPNISRETDYGVGAAQRAGDFPLMTQDMTEEQFEDSINSLDPQDREPVEREFIMQRLEGMPGTDMEKVERAFTTQLFKNKAMDMLARQRSEVLPSEVADLQKGGAPSSLTEQPAEGERLSFTARTSFTAPSQVTRKEAIEQAFKDTGYQSLVREATAARDTMTAEEDTYKKLSEELKEFKIQPFRVYENTLFAVAAALASGLGAAAQSLTGVPNNPMKLIQDAVNMDIAAQEAQYKALKDKTVIQDNIYGRAMQSLNNREKARETTRALAYEMADRQLGRLQNEYEFDYSQAQSARMLHDQLRANASLKKSATGDQSSHYFAASKGLDELDALILGLAELRKTHSSQKLWAADLASNLAGASFMGVLGEDDLAAFFGSSESLRNALPALTTSVLKAVGEKGNLSKEEQEKYQTILERAFPTTSWKDWFEKGPEAGQKQFKRNVKMVRELVNLPRGNNERAKELLAELKKQSTAGG